MLHVKLLSYTPVPEEIITKAARLCYSNVSISEIKVNEFIQKKMVNKMFSLGHHSTLEHAYFTFGIEGISRACSHQLVRHRLASYSQQSQRYVKFLEPFEYIIPDSIKNNPAILEKYKSIMKEIADLYKYFIENDIPAEDSRYILPNACTTKIIVSMNARELLHFFNMRLCSKAQYEIRKIASLMLNLVKKVAPTVFKKAGPTCISYGFCRESAKDCELYKKYIEKND